MIVTIEGQYLIDLLGSVLRGTRLPQPPVALDWEKLYRIAAFHLVSAMASQAIDQLPNPEQPAPELLRRFRNDHSVAMAREANQHVHLEQLLEAFRSHGVACLPLKGCLLKELYPSVEMRLMVDVDLLIDGRSSEKVKGLMSGLGYTLKAQGETHDVYLKKPFMTVEIHRHLMPERVSYRSYFDQVWSRVITDGDHGGYRLSHEDFYVYLIAHIAKHFSGGGTGIRSVMDLWLYSQRYGGATTSEYTRTELQRIGLRKFADNVEALSRVWFGGESGDRWYEEVTGFILSSGSSGTRQNAVVMKLPRMPRAGDPLHWQGGQVSSGCSFHP